MCVTSWLKGLSSRIARRAAHNATKRRSDTRQRSSRAASWIEVVEPRRLLSFTPVGTETRVNTAFPGSDANASVAMDAAGDYVVVWANNLQDGSVSGIYAQRYNAAGVLQGTEFRVNSYTTGDQVGPKVAMDAAGDFVVTWSSAGQDDNGNDYGVYAKRFNASGTALGSEFRVNTYTTGIQDAEAVAMDATGDFVITWQSNGQDGSQSGIFAQRYNSGGIAVGNEFRVNTYTSADQAAPAIAMDSAGAFVVAWYSNFQDGSGAGVYAQRFNAAGVAQGTEFRVNTATAQNQLSAAVAMDSVGDFTITWTSGGNQDGNLYGVYGQRFTAAGATAGAEFQVNTWTLGNEVLSSVAEDATGDFIVTWQSDNEDKASYAIYAQRYSPSGVPDGTEFRVNSYPYGVQQHSAVAMDPAGDFVVSWVSYGQDEPTAAASAGNVYSQRYKSTAIGPIVTGVFAGETALDPNVRLNLPVSILDVDFSDNMNTSSGATGAHSVTNPANWQLLRNGNALHGIISSVFFFPIGNNQFRAFLSFTEPLDDGLYQLITSPSIQSATGLPLDGDANGIVGGTFNRSFFVAQSQAVGGETEVNTNTTVRHQAPDIATDAAGDYVVVWEGYQQDMSGYGIYGQRYSAAGVASGSEFQINTITQLQQSNPTVAMDSDGDFVVSWQSQSDDSQDSLVHYGIYAQRYNANGVTQGGNFLVNSYTTNNQVHPRVAMDQSGDFVIAWQSNNQAGTSSGYDIYARQYNNAGITSGSDVLVNTYTTGNQIEPTVAMNRSGGFIIAWASDNEVSSGSGYDVYYRQFNAFGAKVGAETLANTNTAGNQIAPSVAIDLAGEFVVTWQSYAEEAAGSKYGIYAEEYDAAGTSLGNEFPVNTFTTNGQLLPGVAMDSSGDFTITWESNGEDGSNYGIYFRRFELGTAGSMEFRANTTTTGQQVRPAIAMDGRGDFVVAWAGAQSGGYEIYSQRYQTDVTPMLYGVDITPLNAPASLLTPIVPTILAYDQDNSTWTGATVQMTSNYVSGQDVLGFVNELGITGSWNSATGTLTLTGTSSVSNYRTALRTVTYHNTSSTPDGALNRVVTITVNDGLLSSDPVLRNIGVVTTSVPAVLSGVSGNGTYTEDAPAIALAANLTISDPDTIDLASATVSLTNWQAEDRITFNNIFALQHTLTQNLTTHTATLTISGADTVDHYQTLLRSVVYSDVSDNAVTTNRVASFTVTDGLSTSNAVTRSISVVRYNHAPAMSAIEATPLFYKANDPAFPAQPISASLLVSDPDSSNLSTAVVKISGGYQNDSNGHDVLGFVNQNGISGSWNAAAGTLTLIGVSGDGNYRAALRSVTFSSSGSNVNSAARTLTITSTDADNVPATSIAVTRIVNVTTTNLPPGLTGIPIAAATYVRGASPMFVAANALIFDPDSINLANATIQISANYQKGQDILAATVVGGMTSSFDATSGTLTLSGISSLANYQSVLRSVTYKTNTNLASTADRTLTFVLNDGVAPGSAVTRGISLT